MKKIINAFSLSLSLLLFACSEQGEEIASPASEFAPETDISISLSDESVNINGKSFRSLKTVEDFSGILGKSDRSEEVGGGYTIHYWDTLGFYTSSATGTSLVEAFTVQFFTLEDMGTKNNYSGKLTVQDKGITEGKDRWLSTQRVPLMTPSARRSGGESFVRRVPRKVCWNLYPLAKSRTRLWTLWKYLFHQEATPSQPFTTEFACVLRS